MRELSKIILIIREIKIISHTVKLWERVMEVE